MRIEQKTNVECFQIHDAPALDPITVFLEPMSDRQGRITVVCYGQAWTAFFGAMGYPLVEFLNSCSDDYLAGKMQPARVLKKHEKDYLLRIVAAVKQVLREGF